MHYTVLSQCAMYRLYCFVSDLMPCPDLLGGGDDLLRRQQEAVREALVPQLDTEVKVTDTDTETEP